MSKVSAMLQALIDNPEDLSTLPQAIAKVQELEEQDYTYQERIKNLQDINRSYLAQIPIPGNDPVDDKPEDKTPTFEDGQQALLNIMGGNK